MHSYTREEQKEFYDFIEEKRRIAETLPLEFQKFLLNEIETTARNYESGKITYLNRIIHDKKYVAPTIEKLFLLDEAILKVREQRERMKDFFDKTTEALNKNIRIIKKSNEIIRTELNKRNSRLN